MATSTKSSSAAAAVERHRKKFLKWQNLAPPLTRLLTTDIDEKLVPALEARGFTRVAIWLGDAELAVSGSELQLERHLGDEIDSVSFSFHKYRAPKFQVYMSRRKAAPPNDFIRSAKLVARAAQYYHFWGKPWWLPGFLWSRRGVDRTISRVLAALEQVVPFLEQGTRGPNVSKRVVTTGFKATGS